MVCYGDTFVSYLPDFCRLPKIKAWIDTNNPGDALIPFSVSLEERLSLLSDEEKAAAQKEGAQSSLGKITQAGYASLDVCDSRILPYPMLTRCKLIRYFTCGPDEVRAWTIRRGTKAPQAAGVIQYVFLDRDCLWSSIISIQLGL